MKFKVIIKRELIELKLLERASAEEEAMSSQARKSKVKWTERMNNDTLECKRKAKELASSENPPCNENGRKRGPVDIMEELWDGMGYAQLGLKRQNLRDHTARLEKMNSSETARTVHVERYATVDAVLSTTRSDCTTQDFAENESQNQSRCRRRI